MAGKKKRALAAMVPALVLAASAAAPAAAADPDGWDRRDGRDGGGMYDGRMNDGRMYDGRMNDNSMDGGDLQGDDRGDQNGGDQNGGDQNGNGNNNGQGNRSDAVRPGPRADQFVDIREAPRVREPRRTRRGSRGTFTSECGVNEGQEHSNPDNVVTAPGVQNGAHHIHDYVGNVSTDAFSTDGSLAAADTTCTNGDQSTYYWPVIRLRDGVDTSERAAQSAIDGNVGEIVAPSEADMRFVGNPRSAVVAMPRFTRVITGDAKAATNGTENARALWTCTGFEERGFTDRYPLCPDGGDVVRVLEFPSCWDGRNTDSANHRDHIVFADAETGACPAGTRAVPKLVMELTYDLPAEPAAFALDSFPEQGHDPVTDHGDFINVMSEELMRQAVSCINAGRRC